MSINNKQLHIRYLKSIAFIFSLFFLACTTIQKEKVITAKDLYKKGAIEYKRKNYKMAGEIFKKILDEFPNSKIRSSALMSLASSHFQNSEYEKAKFHFDRFIEQYPANPQVSKAYYLKSMCGFHQMESYEKDQTNTYIALEDFQKVIKVFPKGKYAKLAKDKIKICRSQLAMNLLYIGRYYFGVGAYQASIGRLNELVKNYPKQDFIDEAIFLLGESYLKEDNSKKAYNSFKNLIEKYPNSKYKNDARNRLVSLIP